MSQTFGSFLRQLRRRNGLTQSELANKIGYSRSLVAALEVNRRLPDVEVVVNRLVPLLCPPDARDLALEFVELAAQSRSESAPIAMMTANDEREALSVSDGRAAFRVATPATGLVGRDQEVREIVDRYLEQRVRLITLVGPPGVGKTRVAQAVASAIQPFFADGAAFIPLAEVTQSENVMQSISIALHFRFHETSDKSHLQQLAAHLRRKEVLLVLDNFEQVLDAGRDVATLLEECPGVRVLVTSRERLRLRAERISPVSPLPQEAAVDLFLMRAGAVTPNFARDNRDLERVRLLCMQVDCLPLAIELCAWQTDYFTLDELLERVRARPLDALAEGARDASQRHQSLRAAIQSSWDLLSASERSLAETCALFVGGCEPVALEQIWEPLAHEFERTPKELQRLLVAKNLLQLEAGANGEKRLRMLESIREFVRERALQRSDWQAMCKRHFTYYLEIARAEDGNLRSADAVRSLHRIDEENENIRAAMHWALDTAHHYEAALLVLAIQFYCHLRGLLDECAEWCERLLPHCDTLEINLNGSIKNTYVYKSVTLGRREGVNRVLPELARLAEQCTIPMVKSNLWRWVAYCARDHASACAAYEQAIEMARMGETTPELLRIFRVQVSREVMLPKCTLLYAAYLTDHGETMPAARLATEAEELYRTTGDMHGAANAVGEQGRIALLRGEFHRAQTLFVQASEMALKHEMMHLVCYWQPWLGLATLHTGDIETALHQLARARELALRFGDPKVEATACVFSARAAIDEDDAEDVERWNAMADALDPDTNSRTFLRTLERLLQAGET